MKNYAKTAAAICAALCLGSTGAGALAADSPDAYAILAFSEDNYRLNNHLVTFPLQGEGTPAYTSSIAFSQTSTAGAYATDGRYYVAATKTAGSAEVPDVLVCMDIDKGTTTTVGTISGFDYFINDMTYDHSTSTMYAVAKVDESNSALYTIDLTSGRGMKVAVLDRKFFTLAASWSGQLYAISFAGDFCKIDKTDGAVTVVGHTGYYPEKFQTMEFDHGTRTLWWASTVRTVNSSGTIEVQESYMATVDTATGIATRGRSLGDDQLAGLYIPYVVVADGAPRAVEDLSVTPAADGVYSAVLSWTNPTLTFSGEPIKTISKVEILRDGKPVGSLTELQPGAAATYTDVIASEGGARHTWTVVPCTNAGGEGVPSSVEAFAGTDIPAAVTGIAVERLGNNSVRLTWNPVTTGADGGWIDRSSLTYSVVRNPGEVAVADALTDTEWVEPGVEVTDSYNYTITATNRTGTSAPAVSPDVTLGPDLGFPYVDEFSEEEFAKWQVVDANNDGNSWQYYEIKWAPAYGAYFMADTKAGDDWLISPAFSFEANSTYKVTLRCFAYGNHKVDFVMLKDYDYANPVKTLATLELSRVFQVETHELLLETDEAGTFNLALYQKTESGNSYMIIDRMQIEKLVDNNLAAMELTGNPRPIVGRTYPYAVTVANRGKLDRTGFAVELLDAGDAVVASTTVAETLAAGESMTVYVDCPVAEGLASLRGHVADPLDQIASDDYTSPLGITVMPLGTPEEVTIGTQKGLGSYSPFYLNNKYSVNQQVYSANEIGIARGRITAIRYGYKTSSWSMPPTNVDIKVYLANTDLTTATGGWIPMEELTLVYEGPISMEQGVEDVLELELTRAFDYEGGNLAVVTMHSLENAPQSYYSVQFPYYTSPLADNVPLYYYSYNTPIVYGENPGSKATYYGNSVVTFLMQTGGATLSGTVTDADSAPVAGATVAIEAIHASALTDADGAYKFNFVPNGTYTVTVSKPGYESASKDDVSVADDDVQVNLSMVRMPVRTVSGRVVSADGEPVAGAGVRLEGYAVLTAVTGADGRFSFEEVVAAPSKVVVTKDWYAPASGEFTLDADRDLGDIKLTYAHYPAGNVVAATGADGKLDVSWTAPDVKNLVRFDAGTASSQVGISNNIGTSVLGTAFRSPMVISRLMWQTTAEGGPHSKLNLYVYDLDADGMPTSTLLYSERDIDNTDGDWQEYVPAEPIVAPRGCLVALNYPGFIGLGIDTGSNEYPFAGNTYYYSLDYAGREFTACENLGLDGNLMIRAEGYGFPAENEPVAAVGEERDALPGWYAYNVWRGVGYEPSEWTLLTEEPVDATSFADDAFASLAPGVYRYAVAPVYPDGSVSGRTLSACVLKNVWSTLAVTAVTNSHSADASGARVLLYNADRSNLYESVLDEEGKAEIKDIWKDNYTLELSLPGYEPLQMPVDISREDNVATGRLVLKEIIAAPVNLKVYTDEAGNSRLTWNESGEISDDFESYDAFAAPGSSEMPWKCVDADGGRTFAESVFDFPGRTAPMSFIVFNPKETTPSMFDERTASHARSGEQQLACFASVSGNDDWLISPRLTYHSGFKFGFWAKGYSLTYAETVQVGYSTTVDTPDAFQWIGNEITVPMQQWEHYEFDLPAEARYVAVHSTSADGFTLFIDDVTFSSGNGFDMNVALSGPEVAYEVTLDGAAVATVEEASCPLGKVGDGAHTATVKAVYASGSSDEATVTFGYDGISQVEADGGVSIWPNPAPGYTNVKGAFVRAELFDLAGRLVDSFGNASPRLGLSVAPGVYVLKVYTGSAVPRSFKLVVR